MTRRWLDKALRRRPAVSSYEPARKPGDGGTGTRPVPELVRIPTPPKPLFGKVPEGGSYRTGGFKPLRVEHGPYENGRFVETFLDQPVDETGVHIHVRKGERFYHPVGLAQYALAQLDEATRTGDSARLDAAVVNASALLDHAVERAEGTFFPYRFDFPLGPNGTRVIEAPWWSAMAQGQGVSLFVRLFEATGDPRWRSAADRAFTTLDVHGPREEPWVAYVDRRGYLFFEEYAGNTKPLLVLNGHIFAIFGVHDYYRLTQSEKAAELFDAAVTTLREYLPLYRCAEGGVSYYCLRAPFCQRPRWQNRKYHGIVIEQMRLLAQMTGDSWFDEQADLFLTDHAG